MILKQPRKPLYKRAWFWWLATPLLIILLVLAAFRLSPWPGSMVVRYVFTKNGQEVTARLNAHLPAEEVEVVKDVSYKTGDSDAKLDVYYPKDREDGARLPVVIWTHGGAWLSGDKSGGAGYYKLLAAQGFTVIAPNYTLSPEAAYPTALEQLNSAHKYILEHGEEFHANTDNIVLAGDSAGSQLSAQLAAIITSGEYAAEVGIDPALGSEQLKGVVLNCGIYKMEGLVHPDPSLPKLVGWGDDVAVWGYAGTSNFSDPVIKKMSPYYYVTEDFPATYISGGNGDPLTAAQSKPFADKLSSLGVEVTPLFYEANHQPSLPHEYQFNLDNEDGKNALKQTITFIKTVALD